MKIIILLVAFTARIAALELFDFDGELSEEPCLFVSLGSGCDTGLTLRECGLRSAAFPFDWLITGNHERFLQVLNEDFRFFTDENYFAPLTGKGTEEHPNSLINRYYEILFYHEGSVPYDWSDLDRYREQLERLKVKHTRRIHRFRSLRNYPGKVFFVRNFTSNNRDQIARHPQLAQELRDTLARYFPLLDFTLIIVTYTDVNAPDIKEIDRVIEFKMERPPWREEYAKMYKILIDMVEKEKWRYTARH